MLRTLLNGLILVVAPLFLALSQAAPARAQEFFTYVPVTVTGSGSVSGGTHFSNCTATSPGCLITALPNAQVTLVATALAGYAFDGFAGVTCAASSAPNSCTFSVANNQAVTATFSLITYGLSVTVSGPVAGVSPGTVSSSPSGLSCSSGTCSGAFAQNSVVDLNAAPVPGYAFNSWVGGACAGSTAVTCKVTMSNTQGVAAIFDRLAAVTSGTRLSSVFSSAQPNNLSFLRIVNSGSVARSATITLANYLTGETLANYVTPPIPANGAHQISVAKIETETGIKSFAPQYYTVSIGSMIGGYVQHILFRPSDSTITNLSTCSANVTATPAQVANVHSSLFNGFYSSYVTVVNTGVTAASASLWVYDAATGVNVNSFDTPTIPPQGEYRIEASQLEKFGNNGVFHYVVKIQNQGGFTGFVQHHVLNNGVQVMADMTTVCALESGYAVQNPQVVDAITTPRIGEVYSSIVAGSQSFVRFMNTGSVAGRLFVTLNNGSTGAALGTYTSGYINPNASVQIPISDMERQIGGGVTSPFYTVQAESEVNGNIGHVLYRSATGTLTNSTTCSAGIGARPIYANNVHTSRFPVPGFPSSLGIHNTGASPAQVTLGFYDAATGTKLRTYTTPTAIPANGQLLVDVAALEQQMVYTPPASVVHYNVVIESPSFSGYIQHLVNNANVAVITDMTTMCRLVGTPKQTVTVSLTGSGSVTSAPTGMICTATSCTGQFNKGSSVTLTAAPGPAYSFVRWNEFGSQTSCNNATNTSCTFTANENVSLSATFSNQVPITIEIQGSGTVTSSPGGINCPNGSCQATFPRNNFITLTATPSTGYNFQRWSDPGQISGCNNAFVPTCGFSPNISGSMTAVFTARTVSVSLAPYNCGTSCTGSTINAGGYIQLNGTNFAANTTQALSHGQTVTMTATAFPGFAFDHWEGAGGCSISAVCSYTPTVDGVSIRAYFRATDNGLALTMAAIGSSDISVSMGSGQISVATPAITNNSNANTYSGYRVEVWFFRSSQYSGANSPSNGYFIRSISGFSSLVAGQIYPRTSWGTSFFSSGALPSSDIYYPTLFLMPSTCSQGQFSCRMDYKNLGFGYFK